MVLGELVGVKLSGYVKNPGIVEISRSHGGGGIRGQQKANGWDLYGARVHTSVNKYKTEAKHGPTHWFQFVTRGRGGSNTSWPVAPEGRARNRLGRAQRRRVRLAANLIFFCDRGVAQ